MEQVFLEYRNFNDISIRHAIHDVGAEVLARNATHDVAHWSHITRLNAHIRRCLDEMREPWLRVVAARSDVFSESDHTRGK